MMRDFEGDEGNIITNNNNVNSDRRELGGGGGESQDETYESPYFEDYNSSGDSYGMAWRYLGVYIDEDGYRKVLWAAVRFFWGSLCCWRACIWTAVTSRTMPCLYFTLLLRSTMMLTIQVMKLVNIHSMINQVVNGITQLVRQVLVEKWIVMTVIQPRGH